MLKTIKKNLYLLSHKKTLWDNAKAFHQIHPWKLNQDGIHVRHYYDPEIADCLSWWDECGFVYGKRRIMARWYHPRGWYKEKISDAAIHQCKDKEHLLYGTDQERQLYFQIRNNIEKSLSEKDHGWIIRPSFRIEVSEIYQWVHFTYPMEIVSESDLPKLRDKVITYLHGDKSVLSDDQAYGYTQWCADQKALKKERLIHS